MDSDGAGRWRRSVVLATLLLGVLVGDVRGHDDEDTLGVGETEWSCTLTIDEALLLDVLPPECIPSPSFLADVIADMIKEGLLDEPEPTNPVYGDGL